MTRTEPALIHLNSTGSAGAKRSNSAIVAQSSTTATGMNIHPPNATSPNAPSTSTITPTASRNEMPKRR